MKQSQIDEIREFNRFYTNIIGLLDKHILNSRYSLPEVRILFELYHNPNITASDITSKLDMDKGYLSRILKYFEKQDLIQKRVSKNDKRSVNLILSNKGKAEFEILNRSSSLQIIEIFSKHADNEIQDLIGKMKGIKNLITKKIQ